MIGPTFMIVGAARAGTTALTTLLNEHPDVAIPYKEPNFFAGPTHRDPRGGPPWAAAATAPAHLDTTAGYESLFAPHVGMPARGEASVSYLSDPDAPARIHAMLPGLRIIIILRDPADRAFSHYLYNRTRRMEEAPSFELAIAEEREGRRAGWGPHFRYIDTSRYAVQLARYDAVFPAEQLLCLRYELWRDAPAEAWDRITRHIRVRATPRPDFRRTVNASGPAQQLGSRLRPLAPLWKPIPPALRAHVREWLTRRARSKARLDDETRRHLIEQDLAEDLDRLSARLDDPLRAWRQ